MPGRDFCEGGQWVNDEYTGATQEYIVTDSCQDGNRWCRDDTFHTDLKTESLTSFNLNGGTIDVSNKWNNRKVSWEWIDGPQMDMQLYWSQNAQQYWPAIIIAGINNGISEVLENVNGNWQQAKMNSDMGQQYILGGTTGVYEIQVKDINGNVYHNRSFKFGFPDNCPNNHCGGEPAYGVKYLNGEATEEKFLQTE